MANPSDTIRQNLLNYLYELHKKAKSLKKAGCTISQLKAAMKKKYDYKQNEVVSNLDYLIQKEWVREVIEKKTFKTPKGVEVHPEKRTYKITDTGIDQIEGPSKYEKPERFPGVNITNLKGVTIVGSDNIVNTRFYDFYEALEELKLDLAKADSDKISEQEKVTIFSDIESMKSQLSKPSPDSGILKQIWAGIEKSVTAAGLVEYLVKASNLASGLFK